MNRREALKKTAAAGGLVAGHTTILALLQGCQSQSRSSWTPSLFDSKQVRLVESLVDFILPSGDTPGALDVNVDMMMDLLVAKSYDDTDQRAFLDGLDAFDAESVDAFGSPFAELTSEDKAAMLTQKEESGSKIGRGVWGTSVEETNPGFYRSFKSMAVWLYCSSEEVAEGVLKYDPIPGPYRGCVPLSEVGGVWSL